MANPVLPQQVGDAVQWEHDGITSTITKIDPLVWRIDVGDDAWVLTDAGIGRYDVARDIGNLRTVARLDIALDIIASEWREGSPSAHT